MEHSLEPLDPELMKLWRDIDQYVDSDEAHHVSATELGFRENEPSLGMEIEELPAESFGALIGLYQFPNSAGPSERVSRSNKCDLISARDRVKKTLRLFRALCKELLEERNLKRIDYEASKIVKGMPDYVNIGKVIGPIPGVEIGDEFFYRMELAAVGLHNQPEAGIDFTKHGTQNICISIVAIGSSGYANDMKNVESLIYSGHGGNVGRTRKEPEDQKLEGENFAMKNSISIGNAIRVIRGNREAGVQGKVETIYIYDGLYKVELFGRRGRHMGSWCSSSSW